MKTIAATRRGAPFFSDWMSGHLVQSQFGKAKNLKSLDPLGHAGPFCRAMLHTKATFAGPCVAHQIPFAGTELHHFHFCPVTTWDQDLAFGLAPFLAAAEAWGVGQASSFTVVGPGSSAFVSTGSGQSDDSSSELLLPELLVPSFWPFLPWSPGR